MLYILSGPEFGIGKIDKLHNPSYWSGKYLSAQMATHRFEKVVSYLNEYKILQNVKTA
jgi:hypothetical protein